MSWKTWLPRTTLKKPQWNQTAPVSEPLLRLHGSAALSGSQALHLQRADFALSQFVEIGFGHVNGDGACTKCQPGISNSLCWDCCATSESISAFHVPTLAHCFRAHGNELHAEAYNLHCQLCITFACQWSILRCFFVKTTLIIIKIT
jgi:hypothetical protein